MYSKIDGSFRRNIFYFSLLLKTPARIKHRFLVRFIFFWLSFSGTQWAHKNFILLCINAPAWERLPELFLPWNTHIPKASWVSLFWWISPAKNKIPSVLALPQEICHEKPVPSSGAQTTELRRLKISIDLTAWTLDRTSKFTSWKKEKRVTGPGIKISYFFIWPSWILNAHVTWCYLVLKEWLQRNHLLLIKSSRDSNIINPLIKLQKNPEIVSPRQ